MISQVEIGTVDTDILENRVSLVVKWNPDWIEKFKLYKDGRITPFDSPDVDIAPYRRDDILRYINSAVVFDELFTGLGHITI